MMTHVIQQIFSEKPTQIRKDTHGAFKLKQARLDFLLLSTEPVKNSTRNEILVYRSDHSLVMCPILIKLNEFTNGRELWKLYNFLCYDQEFLNINHKKYMKSKKALQKKWNWKKSETKNVWVVLSQLRLDG